MESIKSIGFNIIILTICITLHPIECTRVRRTIDPERIATAVDSFAKLIATHSDAEAAAVSVNTIDIVNKLSQVVTGTVTDAATNVELSLNAAAAKATADVKNAVQKEKTEVDAALAEIKIALSKIEGIAPTAVAASESAKKLTSDIKNKIISTIQIGGKQLLCDLNDGVAALNVVLEGGKEQIINDAREGATLKSEAIQEALECLVSGVKRSAAGIIKNTKDGIDLTTSNHRATVEAIVASDKDTLKKLLLLEGAIGGASLTAASI